MKATAGGGVAWQVCEATPGRQPQMRMLDMGDLSLHQIVRPKHLSGGELERRPGVIEEGRGE